MRALTALVFAVLAVVVAIPVAADTGSATAAARGEKLSRVRCWFEHRAMQPARRAFAAVRRCVAPPLRRARGEMSLLGDRIAHRLPEKLRQPFARLRLASPAVVASFAVDKVKQDSRFLAWYGVGSNLVCRVGLPAAVGAGLLGPAAGAAIYFGSTAVDLGVVAVRQHSRRPDRTSSFGDTCKALGREYVESARHQRALNHRYMRRYYPHRVEAATAAAKGTLRNMAGSLAD